MPAAPQLVGNDGNVNIVLFNGLYYRVPQSLGPLDVSNLAAMQAIDKLGVITTHDTLLKATVPELANASQLGHIAPRTTHLTSTAVETKGPGVGGGGRGKN
jgi:hypothetical protein